MIRLNWFVLIVVIIYLPSCSILIKDEYKPVKITLLKASSNYPSEKLDWFQAPPDMEFVLEIFNKGSDTLFLPIHTRDHSAEDNNFEFFALLNCNDSIFHLNLYKISGSKAYIEILPKSSKKLATKIDFHELIRVFEKCNEFSYMGDFLEEIALKAQIEYFFTDEAGKKLKKGLPFSFERSRTFYFETLSLSE